jgi:hypothetical protein
LVGGLFHFQHDRSAAISFAELGGLPSALDETFGSDFKIAITKGLLKGAASVGGLLPGEAMPRSPQKKAARAALDL